MAKIVMIKCDNPACTNTDHPEPGGTTKNPRPPYGWLFVSGGWYGSGPYFKDVMVCDVTCLAPAIDAVAEKDDA